jgi:hypothetical protein
MITTRNRLESLQRRCRALERLDPRPKQVLVTVDGYSSETVPFLRRYYPDFSVIVNDVGRGSVASRAAMMAVDEGDLVLSPDDNGYSEQTDWSWIICEPLWWRQAMVGIPYFLAKRQPVSWRVTNAGFDCRKTNRRLVSDLGA